MEPSCYAATVESGKRKKKNKGRQGGHSIFKWLNPT